MFVIQRTTDGKYVAGPGSESSYTARLEQAETFKTHQYAKLNCCPDNEVVRAVADLLQRPGKED